MKFEQVIKNYRNNWEMTMNCFNKTEGHQEIMQGFQNFWENEPTETPTDREVVKNSVYEYRILIYLSRTV